MAKPSARTASDALQVLKDSRCHKVGYAHATGWTLRGAWFVVRVAKSVFGLLRELGFEREGEPMDNGRALGLGQAFDVRFHDGQQLSQQVFCFDLSTFAGFAGSLATLQTKLREEFADALRGKLGRFHRGADEVDVEGFASLAGHADLQRDFFFDLGRGIAQLAVVDYSLRDLGRVASFDLRGNAGLMTFDDDFVAHVSR